MSSHSHSHSHSETSSPPHSRRSSSITPLRVQTNGNNNDYDYDLINNYSNNNNNHNNNNNNNNHNDNNYNVNNNNNNIVNRTFPNLDNNNNSNNYNNNNNNTNNNSHSNSNNNDVSNSSSYSNLTNYTNNNNNQYNNNNHNQNMNMNMNMNNNNMNMNNNQYQYHHNQYHHNQLPKPIPNFPDTPEAYHSTMLGTNNNNNFNGSKKRYNHNSNSHHFIKNINHKFYNLLNRIPVLSRLYTYSRKRPLFFILFLLIFISIIIIFIQVFCSTLSIRSPWSSFHRNILPRPMGKKGFGNSIFPNTGNSPSSLLDHKSFHSDVPAINAKYANITGPYVLGIDLDSYYDKIYVSPIDNRPDDRANATFVILCTNKHLDGIKQSIIQLERTFNHKYNYPYVFLNEEPFTDDFKKVVQLLTKSKVEYGLVESSQWSIPNHLDKIKALECMENMSRRGVYKGGSISYRHMCRFYSGFFFQHPLITQYEYYWRVEPDVEFYCNVDYDPFKYLQDNNKVYGFVIAMTELKNTIPNLWDVVKRYALIKGYTGNKAPLMPYFTYVDKEEYNANDEYNGCHFWTNFEIARVDIWNNAEYLEFFEFLDRWGGFFYERWGDAPIHSLWLGLKYRYDQVHFFHDIGYSHDKLYHCFEKGPLYDKCLCPKKELSLANAASPECITRWMGYIEGEWKTTLNNFHKSSIDSADVRFENWAETVFSNKTLSPNDNWLDANFIKSHSSW